MREVIDRPEWVRQQYADAGNLNARIALHKRFSTNDEPWTGWVLDQIIGALRPLGRMQGATTVRVLELGAGPGTLWVENAGRIPPDWSPILSDLSPGMAATAQRNLGQAGVEADLLVAGAEEIPIATGACDAVVANHMLYHVADRTQALREIRRVLRPDGVLIAATNGEGHMQELHELAHRFAPEHPPEDPVPRKFSLESGERELHQHFADVSVVRTENMLIVTEAEPLAAYILSGSPIAVGPADADALQRFIEDELAREGVIRITPHTGLLIARGPLPV